MTLLDDLKLEGWEPNPGVVASEMAVAGAAIQARSALDDAEELVAAEDFFSIAGFVFAAACKVVAAGKPLEPASVLGELAETGDLERVGGGPYLASLIEHAAVAGSVTWHARKIAEDARRRRVHLALSRARTVAENRAWGGEADVDLIRKLIDEAAFERSPIVQADLFATVNELLDELQNPPQTRPGVAPPYLDLARDYIPTFQPGQLVVIAARPSVGKSVAAVDIVRSAALRDRHRTVLFTLEMSKKEVVTRMLSAEASVDHGRLVNRSVTPDELDRVTRASWRITDAPLEIDDSSKISVDHIRSKLRTMARSGPLGLAVVDYLQLLDAPKSIDIREQQVAHQSKELKRIGRDFNIPVVLLAQLNRNAAQRGDALPRMSEIRESGAVEQDADIVALLHRPDFYEPEHPQAGEVLWIVEKNRGGRRGTVTLTHQLHYSRFADLAWSPTKGLS